MLVKSKKGHDYHIQLILWCKKIQSPGSALREIHHFLKNFIFQNWKVNLYSERPPSESLQQVLHQPYHFSGKKNKIRTTFQEKKKEIKQKKIKRIRKAKKSHLIFVSPELSSVRDYVISHKAGSRICKKRGPSAGKEGPSSWYSPKIGWICMI